MGNLDNLDSACSLEMTKLFNAGRITPLQFILSCLHHLGPPKTRAYHSDDDEGLESGVCRHLWYRFPYGPVAAAIRLCDNDREANKVDAESLALPFVECLSATAAIESIQAACVATSPAVSFENLIQSPLFCQALVVAAIMSKNLPLAKALVLHHGSFPPPPKDQCAFTMRHSSLTGMSQIETSMWTVLIQAGWALSSGDMCYHAAKSPDPRDGIAFFEAVRASESSGILKSRKKRLLDDALCEGTPEVLRYLSDIFGTSLKLEDDMVIQAIEWRDDGGVDMLKWLLDQGLDVNWIRGASDDAEEIWLDPRERAEAFEANRLRPRSNMKSALHAAADRGNADIVKCLLERGANPNSKDGLGQTAQYIAARDGFPETAAVIEKYENSR